jgi:acyl-coenzyme A synthetase/AMP-(fatty) acid ligase
MKHPSLEDIGIIIHSSGSTNFPKPVPLSHAGLLTWMRSLWYTDHDSATSASPFNLPRHFMVWASYTLAASHFRQVRASPISS